MKDLYTELQTLLKEIEEDTKKWTDIPCTWAGKINIVKMAILPKAIQKFNTIPFKIARAFFKEIEQKVIRLVWNHKRPEWPKQS